MILHIEAELVLNFEDKEKVATYEAQSGWEREDALRQVAQDLIGAAGVTVLEADEQITDTESHDA